MRRHFPLSWLLFVLALCGLLGGRVLNTGSFGPTGGVLLSPAENLAFAARLLVWPGLLAGRLGFVHTWLALVVTALALVLIVRSLASRMGFTRATTLALAAFVLAGVLYVFFLPVPRPASSLLVENREDLDEYIAAYQVGYRGGMIDMFIAPEPPMPQAVARGLWSGYFAGVHEWEGLIPGVLRGAYTDVEFRPEHSERRNGFPFFPLE